MFNENSINLGEAIRRQRVTIPLTLQELATMSGVSPSHLGRIERGERYPSARVLRRIAKPLGFGEDGLFTIAGYLSPQPAGVAEKDATYAVGRLDPYVAAVLSQEPVEIQRAVVAIITIFKSLAKSCDIEFRKYVRRKYLEVDEDTATLDENLLKHPKVTRSDATEILTQPLRPEHQEAGLYLEECDHIIYLKRGDEVLGRWSATGASIGSIRDEADRYLNEC